MSNMTEFLRDHGVDLVQFVKDWTYKIVDRKEVNRLFEILTKKRDNNVLILGEPGIGKSFLVHLLAAKILNSNTTQNFHWNSIYKLDINKMLVGTQYRGQLEEKVQRLVQDLSSQKQTILFIDDSHQAFSSNSSVNLMNLLKPHILEGKITCVCVSNNEEFQKSFSKDKILCKKFQKVYLSTMDEKMLMEVLQISATELQKFHGVLYKKEIIYRSLQLARKYFPERHPPDSVINLLDEAGSIVASKKSGNSQMLKEVSKEIVDLENKAKFYISTEKYELLVDVKKDLIKSQTILRQNRKYNIENDLIEVELSDLKTAISRHGQEDKKFIKKINSFNEDLKVNMYGQKNAIDKILRILRRSVYGLGAEKRPVASFLFCGPSGVGKTQLAKIITKHFYGEENLVRLDMSEYSEKFTVSQLIGSPNGYVGFYEGGKLTEAVIRNPHCLVLLDEVEKAHPDVYNLLLQVFDEGHMTAANGQKVNFQHCTIIMTSNLGNNMPSAVGFGNSTENIKNAAEKAIQKFFRVEFLNRIDDIIYFEPLSDEACCEILKKELLDIQTKLLIKDIKMLIDDTAFNQILKKGVSIKYGARFLKRTIYEEIVDPMLIELEQLKILNKKEITVLWNNTFYFEIK